MHMRLLPWKLVKDRVVFSRQHWDRLIATGKAPRPIRLGPHRVAWLEEEVDAWVAEKVSQRDQHRSSE
jgi:prophage regulatory protein